MYEYNESVKYIVIERWVYSHESVRIPDVRDILECDQRRLVKRHNCMTYDYITNHAFRCQRSFITQEK